jgi:hypothetical protein
MIVILLYITVLHYLLYRQHMRQKRHETVTLAMAHLLQSIGASLRDRGIKDLLQSEEPRGPYN